MKKVEEEKITLEKLLEKYNYTLLTLGIFLLLTFSIVDSNTILKEVMAILSAVISYLLLVNMVSKHEENDNLLVNIFKSTIALFTTSFCVWVVFNILLKASQFNWWMIVLWLVFMIIPGIKIWMKKR